MKATRLAIPDAVLIEPRVFSDKPKLSAKDWVGPHPGEAEVFA